jgi:hypothetical protein
MRSTIFGVFAILATVIVLGALGRGIARAADANGKIEAGKPTYAEKAKEFWKDKGRVAGMARNAPAFTVTAFDALGKQVKSDEAEAAKDGTRAYELQWLEPGEYTLKVTAEGCNPLELPKLEIRPNQDLRIFLEFTK